MKFFFLIFFLIPYVNAIVINSITCPAEIYTNEEFYCDIDVEGVNGVFDLKFQTKGINSTINKVWNDGWQRSDWYVNGIIESDGVFKIKNIISNYNGGGSISIKIRESQSKKIVIDETKLIEIIKRENNVIEKHEPEEEYFEEKENFVEDESENTVINLKKDVVQDTKKEQVFSSQTIIKLNSNDIMNEIVYESKSRIVKKVLFCLSILLFVLLLLFQLLKYGKCNINNTDAWGA